MVIKPSGDANGLFCDEGKRAGIEDRVQDPIQTGRDREDAGGIVEVEDGFDVGEALADEAEQTSLCRDGEPSQAEGKGVYRSLDACLALEGLGSRTRDIRNGHYEEW